MIAGAGKLEICEAGWQPEIEVKCDVATLTQHCFFSGKLQSLLLRPSTEWVRPTHILEGNLLYLKSTDGKC